jgi:hypothetical protein
MNLQTLIETANPLAYWTFENFSQDNVYDEYNNNTLINNGCALDVVGNPNANYSDKCCNLNGGYLFHNSTDFTNDILQNQNIIIQFTLKVVSTPVTGFRRLVSKWSPDQQYMIGFENGNLIAKVQTSGGLIELYCDRQDIIYSGRWLNVALEINGTSVLFRVNGYSLKDSGITSISTTNIPNISTNSQFLIGDDTTPFSTDVFISDLSITNSIDEFSNTCYYLTRSDRDIILDLQPEYFFPIADSFSINPKQPIKNLGTRGSVNGYLKGSNINNFLLKQETPDYYRIGVEIPVGGYFTIDDTINLTFLNDYTITSLMFGYLEGVSTSYDDFYHIELSSVKNSLNDYLLVSGNTNSTYFYGKIVAHDSSGNPLINAQTYWNFVVDKKSGLYSVELGKTNQTTLKFKRFAKYVGESINSTSLTDVSGWMPTQTGMKYNRFFYNKNASAGSIIINSFVLFNRRLTNSEYDILQMSRSYVHMLYFKNIVDKKFNNYVGYVLGGIDYDDYFVGVDFSTSQNNLTYANIIDPLKNCPTIYPKVYNLTATTTITNSTPIDPYGNNFVFGCYLYNNNTTSRYTSMSLTRYSANPNESLTNHFCSIWVNSKNGLFDNGYIEFQIGIDGVTDTIQSSSSKVINDGFHHIAVLRNGNRLELWIDGELDAFTITSTIVESLSNTSPIITGGDCFITLPFYASSDVTNNELPKNIVEYLFWGFPNLIRGKTTLDTIGVHSRLASLDAITGEIVDSSSTKVDGTFEFFFEKDEQEHEKFILAQPIDTNLTDSVIVHGPYKPNSIYSKLNNEVFSQTLYDMVLDFQPIAYYKMDDIGTTITDSSGNNLDGVVSGSGYKLNQNGPNLKLKSIYFSGVDDFIDLPDGFSDFTNGLTIECFMKKESSVPDSKIVEFGTSNLNYNDAISLGVDSSGSKYQASIKDSTENDFFTVNTGTSDDFIWEHIVFRIEPDLTVTFWENGLKTYTGTATDMPVNISRTINHIAKDVTTGVYFNGNISNVSIYDYPVPEEEINKHAYYAFSYHVQTLKSLILAGLPQYYWTFDRLRGITDERENLDLLINGSYVHDKNAIVLNRGTIANNYLYSTIAKVNSSSSNKWSLEISFKSIADQTNGILVSEWDTPNDSGTFAIKLESNGSLRLYLVNSLSYVPTTLDYRDGKWHHIVLRVIDNIYEFFVDGVLAGSVSTTNTFGQYNLTLGNDSTGDASTYLDVETHIDDFALYDNRVLSDVEIQNHYEQFMKKKETI